MREEGLPTGRKHPVGAKGSGRTLVTVDVRAPIREGDSLFGGFHDLLQACVLSFGQFPQMVGDLNRPADRPAGLPHLLHAWTYAPAAEDRRQEA